MVETPCPECGSLADKRRSGQQSNTWWIGPAILSVVIGLVPIAAAIGLGYTIRDPQRYFVVILPLSAPAVALASGALLYPSDVRGKAEFGRRWPFLALVFVLSILATVGTLYFWLVVAAILNQR